MDGQQQESQQKQHPLSFLQEMEWTGGGILLGIVFFLTVFLILNYFNILRLWQLYPNQLGFLPHRPYQNTTQQPNFSTAKPASPGKGGLILSCPVAKEFCNSGKYLTYNGNPALVYNLPQKTPVFSATKVVDLITGTTANVGIIEARKIRQAAIVSNDCYTITYTFPPDVSLEKIDLLPLEKGKLLATVSASLLTVGAEKANLVIQVQKRVIDSSLLGKPDFQRCGVTNIHPKESGEFQSMETIEME